MAVIGKGYGHIGFTAAVIDIELISLDKLLIIRCGKAEHDLAHSNYLRHFYNLTYLQYERQSRISLLLNKLP